MKSRTIGGVFTSSPVSLVLSLLFGAGQLVAGVAVAYRLLTRSAWRQPKLLLLLAVALWFAASGITELFVSGMEVAHRLVGAPSLADFASWRGRADTTLVGVSLLLVAGVLGGQVAGRFTAGRRKRESTSADTPQ